MTVTVTTHCRHCCHCHCNKPLPHPSAYPQQSVNELAGLRAQVAANKEYIIMLQRQLDNVRKALG